MWARILIEGSEVMAQEVAVLPIGTTIAVKICSTTSQHGVIFKEQSCGDPPHHR